VQDKIAARIIDPPTLPKAATAAAKPAAAPVVEEAFKDDDLSF
jgi:hypothetical protein